MACGLCDDRKTIKVHAGEQCPHCEDRGEYPYESGGGRMETAPCSSCHGRGAFEEDETITCWWCVQGY